ncbi:kinesin-like protein Klp8 [Entophlyctis luteolus]|nr:kinesin-like protein Klp8 [Entophlyctis luteolus]
MSENSALVLYQPLSDRQSQSLPHLPHHSQLPPQSPSPPAFHFTFDRVFIPDFSSPSVDVSSRSGPASQLDVYSHLGPALLDHAFEGYNVCLFAYGQTGSGKSYTMMGSIDSPNELGIIPRMCDDLFARISELSTFGGAKTFTVTVNYIEIYNEKVRDLLNPISKANLRVREHPQLGPYVEDVSTLAVSSCSQIDRLLKLGNKSRTTASTNMNDKSSRSHAVFTLNLTQSIAQAGKSPGTRTERSARICLVDLAGSERADSTGATGVRLKEGANINKSLTTLGKVISALADASNSQHSQNPDFLMAVPPPRTPTSLSKRSSARSLRSSSGALPPLSPAAVGGGPDLFVPYRDSVLTWLLKDCLGGNSKTVMLATISPAECAFDETLSTLRYAERAKKIINKAVVNENESGKSVKLLQLEVDKLRKKLAFYEKSEQIASNSLSQGDVGVVINEIESSGNVGIERRPSIQSMNSVGSVCTDVDALRDQLVASEKLFAEMTESFESKLQRSFQLEASRIDILNDIGISLESPTSASGAVGISAPKSTPHLVNISDDLSLTNCLLYRIPVGFHKVGSSQDSAIFLMDERVLPEHAYLDCSRSDSTATSQLPSPDGSTSIPATRVAAPKFSVSLIPAPDSQTLVNNNPIFLPCRLSSGDRILFGRSALFKFVDPSGVSSTQWSSPQKASGSTSSPNSSPIRLSSSFAPSSQWSSSDSLFSPVRKIRTMHGPGGGSRDGRSVGSSEGGFTSRPRTHDQETVGSTAVLSRSGYGSIGTVGRGYALEPLTAEELEIASWVVGKWRSRNYVKLAQEILRNASLLKEANIIAKDLDKNVLYDFEIVENHVEFLSLSFWETAVDFSNRSRQPSTQPTASQTVTDNSFLIVRVLDGLHNSMYAWTMDEFKRRLIHMRELFEYTDSDIPSKYYDKRAAKSESSFYGGDERDSNYPRYCRIGSIEVDIRCLLSGILKEIRAPVISQENSDILGWVLVVLSPISARPCELDSDTDIENDDDLLLKNEMELQNGYRLEQVQLGHSLVFEVSILELTGISENIYTQIHCQFRLSEFTGSPSGRSSSVSDRIFATDPVDGFGSNPIRWNFSQTISLDVTQETLYVLERGIATFEIFGAPVVPVSRLIHLKSKVANTELELPQTIAETTPISAKQQAREHVILAQMQISELSHSSGEFKPVPVQTGWTRSDTLKAEFRSPADVFLIRQGIQRRLSIRLSHFSGKSEFPWRRISYVRIGKIRRVDAKTNRPMEDESESSEMIDLKVPGLSDSSGAESGASSSDDLVVLASRNNNRPVFSNNGQSWLEVEVPWDTSVHNNVYLNRITKNMRLELTVEFGVEIDPLNDNTETDNSKWTVFASAAHFERQICVVVHDRDFKVTAASRAMDILYAISNSATSSNHSGTRHTRRSSSVFIVETFPVSSGLVPKRTAGGARQSMRDIDTRRGYVRGQECLAGWVPGGQEVVERFWRRREQMRRLRDVAQTRARIGEHEMVGGGGGGFQPDSSRSEQERMILVAKCVELWRSNLRLRDPRLDVLLYDHKTESKLDDGEEVKFASTKCRLALEMAPVSFRGPLLTPDEIHGSWVPRYFIIRRPYLHIFADSSESEELAIFNLANSAVQPVFDSGSSVGEQGIFAIHSKDCSLLLKASSAAETRAWMDALDPLQSSLQLHRN